MNETILALIFQAMIVSGGHDVSMEEFQCMTYNVYHESRGEGEIGRLAVAHIVVERTKDRRFPSSVCDVVYSVVKKDGRVECAFSWVCDNHSNKIDLSDEHGKLHKIKLRSLVASATIAASVLTNKSANPCEGANYYYNPLKATPTWAEIYTPKCRIGQHTFLRREKGSLL